jgi:hypothetical protein
MKVEDAHAKAIQILAEERRYPTVEYSRIPTPPIRSDAPLHELTQLLGDVSADNALASNRRQKPRTVLRGRHHFQFQSKNYNLLVTLLGRIDDADRSAFLKVVASRINDFPASTKNKLALFPSWNSQT